MLYNLLSPKEMSLKFRTDLGLEICPKAIDIMAKRLGYKKKRYSDCVGYVKYVYTALTKHLGELRQCDAEVKARKSAPRAKKRRSEPITNYYMFNGERDNIDYDWEKNDNAIKEGNARNLTVLWLDDQRDPQKYLNTKSTSATFARNKEFYDNLLKQYNVNFVWVKNLYQFKEYVENNGIPQFVSFDHDLNNRGGGEGLNDEQKAINNGVNCAKWLVVYCKAMGQPLPKFYVHSANKKQGPEISKVLTSESKKIIRLTESDLHRIVKESINMVLNRGEI